jgi:hypothetical protein
MQNTAHKKTIIRVRKATIKNKDTFNGKQIPKKKITPMIAIIKKLNKSENYVPMKIALKSLFLTSRVKK